MTVRHGTHLEGPVIDWIVPSEGKPFVRLAAEAIAARLPRGNGAIDGIRAVVAAPSARGGRMLMGQLLAAAEAEGLRLDPPAAVTAERLADRLLAGKVPAEATSLERTIAWRRALERSGENERRALGLDPEHPAFPDAIRSLAATAITLEDELGREGRTFADAAGSVPAAAALLELGPDVIPDETERWAALGAIRERVAATLARAGLATRVDRERLLVRSGAPRADRLFLVGFLEVSGALRALASRVPTTVILPEPADPTVKAARDAFGVPAAAGAAMPVVPLAAMRVAGGPRSQAEAALDFLEEQSKFEPRPAIDEVAIGVADPTLVATVAAAVRDAGLGAHVPGGRPIVRREPLRALAAALAWRDGRDAASLATLVRGPRAGEAIRAAAGRDPVAELDAFLEATCLVRLDGDLPREANGAETVERIRDWVDEATRPLAGTAVEPKAGAQAIVDTLSALGVDRDAVLRGELEKLLQRLASASPEVVGTITPREAASLVLDLAATAREPVEPRGDEIELLGWLELLLEPARHLCILGMNEGSVPEPAPAAAWLTGSVSKALGLPDSGARLARDAATLEALLRFRPGLRLVFGRSSPAGDPLLPSRLLLGGSGGELAERVQALFASPPSRARRGASPASTGFTVPAPSGNLGPSITSVSVTSLRTYLEDPVRFWLERHERVAEVNPTLAELSAPAFGTLVHDVIDAAFADAGIRASTDEATVREAFLDRLDRLVGARYGSRLRPALRMQVRSMRARLERLAVIEAASRRAGWMIHEIERSLPGSCTLVAPDGEPVRITGRMDRVERRDAPDGPRFRVLDAKTSEEPKSPREAHLDDTASGPEWIDLQLPLYRHFAAAILGVDVNAVSTGYLHLPANPSLVAIEESDFSPSEYDAAVAKAIETLGRIRAGSFPQGGRGRDPRRDADPLRFILQTAVFAGGDGEEEA